MQNDWVMSSGFELHRLHLPLSEAFVLPVMTVIHKLHLATSILQLDFKGTKSKLMKHFIEAGVKGKSTAKQPQHEPTLTQHQHQSGHRIASQKPNCKALHFSNLSRLRMVLALRGTKLQSTGPGIFSIGAELFCREKVHVSKQDIELSKLLRG